MWRVARVTHEVGEHAVVEVKVEIDFGAAVMGVGGKVFQTLPSASSV